MAKFGPKKDAPGQKSFTWPEKPPTPATPEGDDSLRAATVRETPVSMRERLDLVTQAGIRALRSRIGEVLEVLQGEIPRDASVDQYAPNMRAEMRRLFPVAPTGELRLPQDTQLKYVYRAMVRERQSGYEEREHWDDAVSYMAELRRLCTFTRHIETGQLEAFVSNFVPNINRAAKVTPEEIAQGKIERFAERLYRNNNELKAFAIALIDVVEADRSVPSRIVKNFTQSLAAFKEKMRAEETPPPVPSELFPNFPRRDPLDMFRR